MVIQKLVDSDHITTLNSMPIKKICIVNEFYAIIILTMCGKIYALDEFDFSKEYDLTKSQNDIPNNEFVDDFDYSFSVVVLTCV